MSDKIQGESKMKTSHKNKIVVVGAGNVGEAIAYTLMVRKQANDIVLVDINENRAKGVRWTSPMEPASLNRYGFVRADTRNVPMRN